MQVIPFQFFIVCATSFCCD